MVDYLGAIFPAINLMQADSLSSTLAQIQIQTPDIVLLDLHLRDVKGFAAIAAVRQQLPMVIIVVLSGTVDKALLPQMKELGADFFVSKSGRRDELATVLSSIISGNSFVNRRTVATFTPKNPMTGHAKIPAKLSLNDKQLIVLEHLLSGKSNNEIATLTELKSGTVRNYVSDIFLAFDVHTRTQLAALFH